jgi:hypothetical protein
MNTIGRALWPPKRWTPQAPDDLVTRLPRLCLAIVALCRFGNGEIMAPDRGASFELDLDLANVRGLSI